MEEEKGDDIFNTPLGCWLLIASPISMHEIATEKNILSSGSGIKRDARTV